MNCWDVLGIEPTQNRSSINEAYERQAKFVSDEDTAGLEDAYREALTQAGLEVAAPPSHTEEPEERPIQTPHTLSSHDHQVVREVVIQIEALLNDDGRRNDPAIWRAILATPPADDPGIRQQIAQSLEQRIRPIARNGGLTGPVAHYLGSWFGWPELVEGIPASSAIDTQPATRSEEDQTDQEFDKPQFVNFWPAVIGWIIGLIILTFLFGGFGGGG